MPPTFICECLKPHVSSPGTEFLLLDLDSDAISTQTETGSNERIPNMAVLDPWGIDPQARAWIGYAVIESRLWSRYNKALKRNYSTHGRGPGNAATHFWLAGWGRAWAKWRDEFQHGKYTTVAYPMKVDDK